jgi:NAD(P)H-dependent flavin oxidoreductase YrpB (nitropropane dioxygenase family)
VPVISTFWGDPAAVTDRAHAAGALHLHTVGTAEEAKRVVEGGVDVVVAQGWEAGGHVWGQVTTMALVPAVVDAVQPVPVIAAGGIGDGRGLAAVLALGAQAGWLGSRFLTATEAATHQAYRRQVLDAAPQDAVYTRCLMAAGRMRRTGRSATPRSPSGKRQGARRPQVGPGRARSWPPIAVAARSCAMGP